MSWRDDLRPASFRGMPFMVESSEQKLGRRTALFEYPGRDEPSVEDMGARAWGDSLTAFLIGENHLGEARILAMMLNAYGPGELVHPFLGTLQVQIGEVTLRHSSREGGLSTFTIELLPAPPLPPPVAGTNTDTALQESCDKAEKSLLDEFEEFFGVEGMTQGLVDELSLAYDTAMEAIAPMQDLWATGQNLWNEGQTLWAKGQSYLSLGQSWIATGQSWVGRVAGIASSFSNPSALGGGLFYGLRDILGVFGKVGGGGEKRGASASSASSAATAPGAPIVSTGPSADKVLDVLRKLPSVESTRLQPVNLTASRQEQVKMQSALLDLVHSATVIAAAQASSLIEYRDAEQAAQVQDAFLEAIEQSQQTASDMVYQHLEQVRVDLIKDLSARGAGLPSVTRVTPISTLPALVQAYQLYGDSSREGDLVERNQLPHPGFIPAGEELEVVR